MVGKGRMFPKPHTTGTELQGCDGGHRNQSVPQEMNFSQHQGPWVTPTLPNSSIRVVVTTSGSFQQQLPAGIYLSIFNMLPSFKIIITNKQI